MKRFWFLTLALSLVAGTAAAKHETLQAVPKLTLEAVQSGEAELLDPELAFALHTRVTDEAIIADYFIAEGYYAYRDKFGFSVDDPDVVLGPAEIPPGKIKDDEFFGRMEIYRHQVSIRIPYTRSGAAGGPVTLKARSQGCADIGVCYPPQTQTVSLALPAASQAAAGQSSLAAADPVASLSQALGFANQDEEELLDPEQAYVLEVSTDAEGALQAHWTIAEGYYLYQDKMKFELQADNGARLAEPVLSKAKHKTDPFFGDIQAYYHQATARLPVDGPAGQGVLKVGYQGCNEVIGVCYPPINKEIQVSWDMQPVAAAVIGQAAPAVAPPAAAAPAAPIAEQDRIAGLLGSGATWLVLLSFFGFGLLLTFTPCVLPMIPILSSIIVGQGETVTTRRAFVLSLVYVLAMASTYAVAGVLVGLSGENVQAWFQNPWVLGAFAALFVALAMSMFGFYELQMPGFIQERLATLSNRQQGGTLTGVAVMGLLSALIVGPCVTAPLVGALIYIAQTGDALMGGAALLSLGLGMGVPLLLVGTSAGKLLPRAGAWMESVKAVFGVMILGLAIWMLERVLPLAATMALWAMLLIGSAIYMGALEPLREGVSGWRRLWKALGLVMLLHGGLMLIGAAAGGTSLLYPLKGLVGVPTAGGAAAGASQAAHGVEFRQIKGLDGLQRVLAEAKAQQRPVMLDFYADWCISCKEMEAFTFSDAGVQAALSPAILVQTDVTDNDEQDKALLKSFGLFGPPAILFFGADGVERRSYRVVGFMKAEPFRDMVERAFGS